jgi:hypothetical protein
MWTQFSVAAIATTIAGIMMVTGAIQKRMLERRRTRTCPACGRRITARVCEVCTAGTR